MKAPMKSVRAAAAALAASAALVIGLSGGCSEEIIEQQKPLGGTCLACHDGITDVHPFFALACVDCHGGNDNVPLPAVVNTRDQALLKVSHVLPLDSSMWWPNGIDDDDDGEIDEQGEYFDGRGFTDTDTPFADARIAKKDQMDSEMNRDLNYLRFLNPGDLRVADATCGSRNKNANEAMVCHAEVVYDVRRSIMASHSGVPAGATYGNAQLPKALDFGAAFASSAAGQRFDARNPRIGRVGYILDYDAMDNAFDANFTDDKRNLVAGGAYNRELLVDNNQDPNDDKFEARAGPIFADGQTGSDAAFAPAGGPGFTRTGQKHKFFIEDVGDPASANNRPVEVLQPISNASGSASDGGRVWPDKGAHPTLQLRLAKIIGEADASLKQNRNADIKNRFDSELITNPVDAALRNFRAYHSLNWVGPNDNFGFVDFFTSPNANDPPRPDPSDTELRNKNNPFGRGRPTGCTSCHVVYNKDGRNEEPIDRTVADNGRNPSTDLPYGIRTDRGERFYAKRHEIKRTSEIEQCGACHGFVTRVDVQMLGTYEQETDFTNTEQVNTIGDFEYVTPNGTTVRFFDNLAHYKNGRILNDGEGVSEDLNNNGELDTALEEADFNGDGVVQPNEDFNGNGKHDIGVIINEDKNGNGKLDIPDRLARSESFDGRQNRIIYGGGNGAVRLQDIHLERGFRCVDCHIQNDVHGDGNVYTRNWDAIQIECEDCHGTNDTPAPLVFSGPNGGDDMTAARYNTAFGSPWFERIDGKLLQRSRVDPNLSWIVPELTTPKDNTSAYAHRQPLETFDDNLDHGNAVCGGFTDENSCTAAQCSWNGETCGGFNRAYAHVPEPGERGGLECYSCHSSWQPNCLSCHIKMDVSKPKQEIWWGDDDVEEVFFQLFSYTRSPFYLGISGNVENNRIATHRSTMQVHVTVVASDLGVQLAESAMFSTQENFSSMVSNPYFPHTVRTVETKQCARCHTLEDNLGRVANDHMITEATAHGTGRYQNIGDWAVVATGAGLDLLDVKKEGTIAGNGGGITFPGFDFSDKANGGELRRRVTFELDTDPNAAVVTPAFDVVMQRGVSVQNGSGDVTDLAIVAHSKGVSIVDVFGRDNNAFAADGLFGGVIDVSGLDAADKPFFGMPPTEIVRIDDVGAIRSVDIVDTTASQTTTFIALSDEELLVFDYRVALGINTLTGQGGFRNLLDPDAGTGQNDDDDFEFVDAGPGETRQGSVLVGSLPHGLNNPTRVRLYGRFALVTHAGGFAVFHLDEAGATKVSDVDLGKPLAQLANFETSRPALDIVGHGRFAYVATGEGGVEVFDIGPVVYPLFEIDAQGNQVQQPVQFTPVGTALTNLQQPADTRGIAMWGSRLVVADGRNGLRILDCSTPADCRLEETISNIPGGGRIDNASQVVMAAVPTRTFAMVANGNNLLAVNVTPVVDFRLGLKAAFDNPDAFRGLRMSHERGDPLTPFDPKNATRQIFTFPASGPVTAISRGSPLDNMADKSGRKLRDAWPIGSRSLPERMLARMRSVVVKEVPNTKDSRGDGMGCVVREGDEGAVQVDQATQRCIPDNVP
jgi:hypothetical protein